MKPIVIYSLLGCGAVQVALWGAEKQNTLSPEETLRLRLDAAVAVLQDDRLDLETKGEKITELVAPLFDFPLMGKLALGREHWQSLNAEQRIDFTELFTVHLKNAYRKKLMLYTDEQIVYKSVVNRSATRAEVLTELVSEEKQIDVSYKLRKLKGKWKIYDVKVQGVSLRKSYEAQFHDILSRGTPADLFAALRDQKEEIE
ncbi:MAG: ABC transporter substrate-binding protein [Planctomycetes bacterium]|nr:ABC transporter substrate-binding protein [Planctomycetota bacterium]